MLFLVIFLEYFYFWSIKRFLNSYLNLRFQYYHSSLYKSCNILRFKDEYKPICTTRDGCLAGRKRTRSCRRQYLTRRLPPRPSKPSSSQPDTHCVIIYSKINLLPDAPLSEILHMFTIRCPPSSCWIPLSFVLVHFFSCFISIKANDFLLYIFSG